MAEAEEIILDASVVVKWFSREEFSDKALDIKSRYEAGKLGIIAPSLLMYEVINALRYNPAFGSDELKRAARDLEDMQITLYDFKGEFVELAVEYAYRFGLSIYDAAYVSLALRLGKRYYTVDQEVVNKASSSLVRHLREW